MLEVLHSKIHKAVVTDANLNYEGSITISADLIKLADLHTYQRVLVVDINNGQRFETYVIETPEKNVICLNGAAARLVTVGDRIIVMAFKFLDSIPPNYEPNIVLLNEKNEVV